MLVFFVIYPHFIIKNYRFEMNLRQFVILTVIISLVLIQGAYCRAQKITSFSQLGQFHCSKFPIEILYRLSSGTLAEKYGQKYAEIDCYVHQFINQDGQNQFDIEDDEQQQDEESNYQTEQEYIENLQQQYQYPQIDPIVEQYSKGIERCLPEDVNPVNATYKIWRFYRYLFQHDYAFEWMRAKVRSTLGYEAERPNSWMDGQQNQKRLRLQKLFSNQFYDYVDKLMFKDFLFPLMTFIKKNVVIGLQGSLTSSGKPILLQFIESRNVHEEFFQPIIFSKDQTAQQIFSYTLPGIPLLLGGTSMDFMWAFSGVLIDRSNIEQIETVGSKFYHHGIEQWIKLDNFTKELPVKDSEPYICKFMHSSYGTLFHKHQASGKISEYIARWHEDEVKVRNLFSEVYNLIKKKGVMQRDIEFPFNSILMANQSGVFHYVCDQYHPSYFLYPDLASQPDRLPSRWVSNPKRGMFIIANTHLTTINQKSYINKQILNPIEQQLTIDFRKLTKQKVDIDKIWDYVLSVTTDPLIRKRLDILIFIYRKSKFLFLPDEDIRKQCDQLISILEKWDYNIQSELHSSVFILWDYLFKQFTFSYFSHSQLAAHILRYKALTDSYWTGQPDLWKQVVSYGQCSSNEWSSEGWNVRLNNTGLNCTCFFNVIRGLNRTRQILRSQNGRINPNIGLSQFNMKKLINLTEKYIGDQVEQAFDNFYSKNLGFISQLDNPQVVYLRTYQQIEEKVRLCCSSKAIPEQKYEEEEVISIMQQL